MIKNLMAAPPKDLKEIITASISGSLAAHLEDESKRTNLSKSEIVEFALRRLFALDTDNCRSKLTEIYKINPAAA